MLFVRVMTEPHTTSNRAKGGEQGDPLMPLLFALERHFRDRNLMPRLTEHEMAL